MSVRLVKIADGTEFDLSPPELNISSLPSTFDTGENFNMTWTLTDQSEINSIDIFLSLDSFDVNIQIASFEDVRSL